MRVPEELESLRKYVVLTDEACNAVEVQAKQSIRKDCGESAEFLSRGMIKEMF